jgi:hypothetical protein
MRKPDGKPLRLTFGSRRVRALVVVSIAVLQLGCSGSHPYDLVNVSGKVTYEDGSLIPAKSIMLKFNPEAAAIDTKTHPRKGFALVDVSDGTFEYATTHTHADGLVAGKHKVLIVAHGEDGKAVKIVPKEYLRPDTTPVEVDTENATFEIKVKKPTGV